MKQFIGLSLAFILCLMAAGAWGATYYVCTGGDGSAPTTGSCATAYANVEDAFDANSGANTIQLLSNIAEPDTCQIGDNDDSSVIDLNGYEWSSDGSFNIILSATDNVTGITVKNGTLKLYADTEDGKSAIQHNASGCDNWTWQDLYVDLSSGNHGYFVSAALESKTQTGWVFERIVIVDNAEKDDIAFYFKGGVATTMIRNCVVLNCNLFLIVDDDAAGNEPTSLSIYNCSFYNVATGIAVYSGADASNTTIKNTIFHTSPIAVLDAGDGPDPTFQTNAFVNCTTNCDGCTADETVTSDPTFVNPGGTSARDYRLRHTSPCIDAGTTITGITTDYMGRTRLVGAAVDIGAIEFRPKPKRWYHRLFRRYF